jgi:3-methyladenine DNA glycosylase AlkD
MLDELKKDLKALVDPLKAEILPRFFKTGKGEYGEGDVFLGVIVPNQRKVAKKYRNLPLSNIQKLLLSEIHEYRLTALFILVEQYKKASSEDKKTIAEFYIKNSKRINNWDLVDSSASYILGDYFFDRDRSVLYKFAESSNLWERRIAIIATQEFIRKGDFKDTFKIAKILLSDKHDLIHKAVGWMLREVGNRDLQKEIDFLDQHYKTMPRTMLRYAIEKFDPQKRSFYLARVGSV